VIPEGIELRRLTPADAAAYRAFMLAAYLRDPQAFTSSAAEREALPLSWWGARLAADEGPRAPAPEQVLGAWAAKELVGVAGLALERRERTRHRGTLFGMAVAPAWRRRGLGRRLVQAVLGRARLIDGIEQVQLTVSRGNGNAERLYESCGFVAWGVEPQAVRLGPQAWVDKVHMACRLVA
jgi:RimJ/RimL family protein N-acetyltransferase